MLYLLYEVKIEMFEFDWNVWTWTAILVIAFAQLVSIVIFGWAFGIAVRFKHRISSESSRLFEYGNYVSQSVNDSIVDARFIPKNYQFVIVKYDTDNQVVSETFYSLLGDTTHVTYLNGRFSGLNANYLSNTILYSSILIGFGLIKPLHQLQLSFPSNLGIGIICSFVIAASIKQSFIDPFNR